MPLYRSDDIETVLIELQAGIVPTGLFMKNIRDKKDSFEGMDQKEARKMKRKWRKLKKKFKVRKASISHAAYEIRFHLREEKKWH
tara:strand:- start:936 stop:1190 length:255 start_codon:yes stop_codon:yes gene_type:complete